ncbi:MAG: calcium-binding protein [Alphaproteobacteria bacterium]|nr:calcium-binding protein [Alphaproteobacteria bacterium]
MVGGAGDDTYTVDSAGDVIVDSAGTDTVNSSASIVVSSAVEIVNLTGTGNLNATGLVAGLNVTGNTGNNTIRIDAASFGTLTGGTGDDVFDYSAAAVTTAGTAIGGAGDDTFIVGGDVGTIVEAASEGTDTVVLTAARTITVANNVENAVGSVGADVITGNTENNVVNGGAGADTLVGAAGNDNLDGGAGIDTLQGDAGSDVLVGGAAADVFRYTATTDGGDSVADFATTVDKFNFTDAGFDDGTSLTAGALTNGVEFEIVAGAFDGTNGTSTNFTLGNAAFVFSTVDNTLYYDANGAGAGFTAIATLDDGAAMVAADIVIV